MSRIVPRDPGNVKQPQLCGSIQDSNQQPLHQQAKTLQIWTLEGKACVTPLMNKSLIVFKH